MSAAGLLPVLFGVLGLFAAYRVYALVLAYPAGEGKVAKIAAMIHLGAMVFMKREYKVLAVFAVIVFVLLVYFLGFRTGFAFIIGALASATAGYIGMYTATQANSRTTTAAHTQGAPAAIH